MEIAHRGKAHKMTQSVRPTMKDPDLFFPEQQGDRPDPLGKWLVRGMTTTAERFQALRSVVFRRRAQSLSVQDDVAPKAGLVNEPGS
jgi:hypothetical protein